mmetsp:Transcript_37296/g.47553  ORF Transcript_37296/g.47553 Transcript_37296/m.47553 type:complete len:133 (-) Transcript_37296:457-855(-)
MHSNDTYDDMPEDMLGEYDEFIEEVEDVYADEDAQLSSTDLEAVEKWIPCSHAKFTVSQYHEMHLWKTAKKKVKETVKKVVGKIMAIDNHNWEEQLQQRALTDKDVILLCFPPGAKTNLLGALVTVFILIWK